MIAQQQIKVAIADDHKIFRDGIRMALKDKEYLKILWEAEDGKDLMHKLQLKLPAHNLRKLTCNSSTELCLPAEATLAASS